jgi:hypothetical protein
MSPKFEMTPAVALFICTIIKQEKYRFSYGRKWNLDRMRTSEIHLPIDDAGQPDWEFMTKYVEALKLSSVALGSHTDIYQNQ